MCLLGALLESDVTGYVRIKTFQDNGAKTECMLYVPSSLWHAEGKPHDELTHSGHTPGSSVYLCDRVIGRSENVSTVKGVKVTHH
jgi:hypothetical protein